MSQFRKEDLEAVSDFLDQRWDPIGVYDDEPDAVPGGEYATYASMILGDLYAGASRDDLLRHFRQARQMMGLEDAPDRGRDVEVVKALLMWWGDR